MGVNQHRCSARYWASGMMPRSPHTSMSVGPRIPYTVLSLVSLTPRMMATARSSPWMIPGSHDSHTPCLHLSIHLLHVPQMAASNWAVLPSGAKSLSHGGLRSRARCLVIVSVAFLEFASAFRANPESRQGRFPFIPHEWSTVIWADAMWRFSESCAESLDSEIP